MSAPNTERLRLAILGMATSFDVSVALVRATYRGVSESAAQRELVSLCRLKMLCSCHHGVYTITGDGRAVLAASEPPWSMSKNRSALERAHKDPDHAGWFVVVWDGDVVAVSPSLEQVRKDARDILGHGGVMKQIPPKGGWPVGPIFDVFPPDTPDA